MSSGHKEGRHIRFDFIPIHQDKRGNDATYGAEKKEQKIETRDKRINIGIAMRPGVTSSYDGKCSAIDFP